MYTIALFFPCTQPPPWLLLNGTAISRLGNHVYAAHVSLHLITAPQEIKAQEKADREASKESGIHIEQLFDDPELQKLHEERLHKIAEEQVNGQFKHDRANHRSNSSIPWSNIVFWISTCF